LTYLVENGVRSVYGFLGEEYASPPLQSPRDFHEFVTAPETELFDLLHRNGARIHVHCHGPMDSVLEEFAEMGADCLHPIEAPPLGDMPLREAKRRIGSRVCLEGNIQIGDLYAMETTAFRQSVVQAMEDAAEGGGFILCPSASPHTPELSPRTVANYLAMIEIGRSMGRYA
jgi:uroporphyrinogen-III decarboxylase